MPRYDGTRDVTPKYVRRMLHVPPFYAITSTLKRETKRNREEMPHDDETRQTSGQL